MSVFQIFLITFSSMLLVIFLMALGVIFNKKVLKGSCGGLGKVMGEDCMFCEKKDECESDKKQVTQVFEIDPNASEQVKISDQFK